MSEMPYVVELERLDVQAQLRVTELEALFNEIANTRMNDIPICNPHLNVQAVGFEVFVEAENQAVLMGILITPWFMNLLRLPCEQQSSWCLKVGEKGERLVHGETFSFIGAYEPAIGAYESCSLASPLLEWTAHSQVLDLAQSIIEQLKNSAVSQQVEKAKKPELSRRGFLFGRSRG